MFKKLGKGILLILLIMCVICSFQVGVYAKTPVIKKFTVVLYTNGGTGKTVKKQISYTKSNASSEVVKNVTFSKNGYTFYGWNTKANGKGNKIATVKQAAANVKSGKTLKLYAQWKANNYYVSYNACGGRGTMAVQKFTYGKTTASTKNKFSRTGYTFVGWNTKADGKGTSYPNGVTFTRLTSVNKKKVTLYAQWKPITFDVFFSCGEGGGYEYEWEVQYGVFKPAYWDAYYMQRDGYELVSWDICMFHKKLEYTGKSIAIGDDVSKLSTKNGATVYLYPKWEEEEYSITYSLNGGENAPDNPSKYSISDGAIPIHNPMREGYTFAGWSPYEGESAYYKDVVLPIPDDDPSGEAESWELHNYRNLTLYACWTVNQ